jgi:hypothetical protein
MELARRPNERSNAGLAALVNPTAANAREIN